MVSIQQSTDRRRPELRDYQLNGDEEIRDLLRAGKRRILTVAPTGAGKGTWMADLVWRAAGKGRRSIFVVSGREIVLDFSKRLDRLGLDHGVIMGSHPRRAPWLNVHVASIDTLRRRNPPPADILLFDECDVNIDAWTKLIALYPDAIFIGATATPVRVDGRGLGELFEAIVEWPQASELVSRGYLAPVVLYGPSSPDLSGIRRIDKEQSKVAGIMDRPKLTGDALEHWLKHGGEGMRTAAFGVNRAHAKHIQETFIAAGFRWEYVDGETKERQPIWDALESHRIHGVASVGVIGRGWDMPSLACLLDLAPTDSLARCLQRWGRVFRAASGKDRGVILDHAGNWQRHGLPLDFRQWSLDSRPIKQRDGSPTPGVRMCQQCWAGFPPSLSACPYCGWVYVCNAKEPEVIEGDLVEITRESVARELLDKISNNAQFQDLVGFRRTANERGYKRGYPAMQYRLKHGEYPPRGWMDAAALLVDPKDAPARQELLEGVA